MPFRSFGKGVVEACNTCRTAWNGLSKFTGKRYQFRYIEPKAGLPNVFIYGDSISIAYTEYARATLKGRANVYRLHENGASSHEFITKMETLRKAMFQPYLKGGWDFDWDVIHFNVGLHDLKYVLDGKLNVKEGEQVSSLQAYEKNLRSIIAYLKKTYPKAKLIFATTTPVPKGAEGRIAGDAKRYNEVALGVLGAHQDIQINDLHGFSMPALKEYTIDPTNVHYTEEGARLQGMEVAKIIAKTIGVEPGRCPSVSSIGEKIKKYGQKE